MNSIDGVSLDDLTACFEVITGWLLGTCGVDNSRYGVDFIKF
jgi:hypothetical protein